jgi:methylphosphonate synthase
MENESKYLARVGARLLNVANDLKRTPDLIADELGRPHDFLQNAIRGEISLEDMHTLVLQVYAAYPISMSELWVERDQTNDGLAVMTAEQSEASSRTIERTDSNGITAPYYQYRDTAMVREGPYKPEWIKELKVVTDTDPENPGVVYNKGHLMHQQTFFIGEVNFYWDLNGQRFCREMNTGDSNYITPYVPHSFTSRNSEKLGLIVAVTFASAIEHARASMLYADNEDMSTWFGDTRMESRMFAQAINRHRENEMLSVDQLADRLREYGINIADALARGDGPERPTAAELDALANALNIYPDQLAFPGLAPEQEVVVQHRKDQEIRAFGDSQDPSYLFYDLARSRHLPNLKGYDFEIVADHDQPAELKHGMHEYIYNYGDTPVSISYADGCTETIKSGDSAYISPLVSHRFSTKGVNAHVAVVRVAGGMTKEAVHEIASYSPSGRSRAKSEITQWF